MSEEQKYRVNIVHVSKKTGEKKVYNYDSKKYYNRRLDKMKEERAKKKINNPETDKVRYSRKNILKKCTGLTQEQKKRIIEFIDENILNNKSVE